MNSGIFVDTSGWYATIARKDSDHELAKHFLINNTLPLITSDYIMDETVTLLQSRLGHHYAIRFLDTLHTSQQIQLVYITTAYLSETIELFRQ